jgi:hypothetical protein
LFHGVENFRRVSFGGRFVPDFGDAPVRPDQKRRAHDPQERFAKELLYPPRAISLNGLEFRVAQQREVQIVFSGEFSLSLHGIAATTQDYRAEFVELRFGVAKLGRFVDSTRGERFGEKIQDYSPAAQTRESNLLPIGCLQFKVRSFVAHLEHFGFTPDFFSLNSWISCQQSFQNFVDELRIRAAT